MGSKADTDGLAFDTLELKVIGLRGVGKLDKCSIGGNGT